MSAIPLRKPQPDAERICILELCNTGNTLDLYSDRLSSLGYEVVSTTNYDEAVKLAHQCHPSLVVVYDDPATNIDAVRWIEMQHMDSRVVVLQRRADTLNQLTRMVRQLLHVWQLDQRS